MNRVALITGASSEIGSSIAIALASNNIDIVIHYNQNEEKALKLQKELENKYKVQTLLIKADLTNEEDINSLVEK